MKRYVLLSLLIVLLFAFPVIVSPQIPAPEKAVPAALYRKNGPPNWAEPNKEAFLAGARRGDASAQFWLGEAYEQGLLGNAPDFREALRWLRKSAAQDNPDAQNEVGRMYEKGEGVTRNYVAAAAWYRKAAEHVPDFGGASQGRNNLAMLYMNGLGVPKDYVKAYMWLSLTNFERSLADAKTHLSSTQVLEAERMAEDWKCHHPEPRD
jgi:tetratricopeptide (TPR) repeat protein